MVGTELVKCVNLGGTIFGAENFQSFASVKGGRTGGSLGHILGP